MSKPMIPGDRIDHDTFTDACKHITLSEYVRSIPMSAQTWDDYYATYDLFTDSARPGETRLDCKRRLHAEQKTMANDQKKLTPRTKREKALVSQTRHEAFDIEYQRGYKDGKCISEECERQRGESFLLKVIASQAAGKVARD